MSKVLIPGSFDPITQGHLDVITRAAARFEKVVVAVMNNDMHKYVEDAPIKHYMFDLAERREMTEIACAHLPNVSVIAAGGMLAMLFDQVEADWVIKGVRSTADFEYEQAHALYNRSLNSRMETLYMPADPAYDGLSSTLVRQKIRLGESIEGLVPMPVAVYMAEHTRPM